MGLYLFWVFTVSPWRLDYHEIKGMEVGFESVGNLSSGAEGLLEVLEVPTAVAGTSRLS